VGDGPNKKVASSLLALSSAAVLAVYAAGYTRTRAAADRFAHQADARRPVGPAPVASAAAATHAGVADVTSTSAPPPVPSQARKPRGPRTQPKQSTAAPMAAAVAPAPEPIQTSEAVAPAAAPAPVAEAVAPPPAVAPKYKDGTYYGWGTSRHGDIQAAVVIEDGRIASATIAQCLTRYSCNVIATLPPQVAQRQSPEVDYVSGATQSTNAFYYAVVEALAKAKL